MALFSLFFSEKSKIDCMELDAVLQETHSATATPTENPIEDGALITDHVILNPIELTMDCVISQSPLGLNGLVGSTATAIAGQALGGDPTGLSGNVATTAIASVGGLVAGGLFGSGPGRDPADVYNFLLQLQGSAKRISIVTGLLNYDDMILASISVPRSSSDGNTIRFTCSFKQIQIVSSDSIIVNAVSSVADGAQGAAKLGKQSASRSSAKTSNDASILYQAGKAVSWIP